MLLTALSAWFQLSKGNAKSSLFFLTYEREILTANIFY